jgi:hypothetical protein
MKIIRFEPKEDITTYELARIFKLNTLMMSEGSPQVRLGIPGYEKELPSVIFLNDLPENVKRHLVILSEE